MTHGARGEFLAFKAAPPSLHRALVLRQDPHKQKAKPVEQCFAFCIARSLWVPAVAMRWCSLSFGNICSTVKSCYQNKLETLCWKRFFPSRDQEEPKPDLLFLSTPKVSNKIACFANRSQLCDGLDESVLLHADILGTHW